VIVDDDAQRWSPDALLVGPPGAVRAHITRQEEEWAVDGDPATMLAELGTRGLTRVFIHRDTPLAQAVMSAGLVDRR
jgi:hypothetical protein